MLLSEQRQLCVGCGIRQLYEVWSQSLGTASLVEIKENFSGDWNVRFLLLTRNQTTVFSSHFG